MPCWCRNLPPSRCATSWGSAIVSSPTKLPRTAFILRDGKLHPAAWLLDPRLPHAAEAAVQEHLVFAARQAANGHRAVCSRAAGAWRMSRLRISCDAASDPRPWPTSPNLCSPAFMPAMSSGFRCAHCFRGSLRLKPTGSVMKAFRGDQGPVELGRRVSIVPRRPWRTR